MSAISPSLYPPSNRRRCVKGRPSYTEPSDHLLSASISQDPDNEFDQNDYSFMDPIEPDDVEEEPITIDLSAFLNENPLLAQSAFESSTENNIASTESSSQFRVTDCKVAPSSEIPKSDFIDESYINDAEATSISTNIDENMLTPMFINPVTTLSDSAKENCSSPEKLLTTVHKEPTVDITLNGISPVKKFSRARPLGLSNPLKKYKNFMKAKDLNKVNEKVFGKYPIVKCEKLDIENFVKNNKIKVGNWPLLCSENQTNKQLSNKNANKKINLAKHTLKPKFMRKSISFNKYFNSNLISENNANSILVDKSVSKPIVIKTNAWKPGITNISAPVPSFFKTFMKSPSVTSKTAVRDILKLNDKSSNYKTFSVSKKETEKRNKSLNNAKNYPLIAPKPTYTPDIVTLAPSTSKPVLETFAEPILDEFTVIEPYIDDPSSPQKPKSILTLPLEVISPEKQNPSLHSNTINKAGISKKIENTVTSTKSIFLNGAVRQIRTPGRVKINASSKSSILSGGKLSRENTHFKRIFTINAKDESPEDKSSISKVKNAVVDAMQSAFSTVQKKRRVKQKTKKKDNFSILADTSTTITSYNSILNHNLYGFSDNDFEDFSFNRENVINTNFSDDITTPPDESSSKTARNKCEKRKRFGVYSPYTSDTLSASEGENTHEYETVAKITSSKRKKSSTKSLRSTNSLPLIENSKESDGDPITSINTTVHSEVLNNAESNKVFDSKPVDSSFSFISSENDNSKSPSVKNDLFISPETSKHSETSSISIHETSTNNVENSHPNKKTKVCNNSPKQEICTRTLRERKCSSTEVDKFSDNSVKQSPNSKNSPEKTKVKGSINSKLKIQMKMSPKSTAKVKLKRKSCKPEDIIREINTITGGHRISEKASKKHEKSDSGKNKNSEYSVINQNDDSESNSSASYQCSRQTRQTFLKKPLKVRFKRSKKKNNASSSGMPLNSFTDVIESANSPSSISESNITVHSSFRDGKVCNMGTPHKEENTTENSTSVSDCNMEIKKDEKCIHEENSSANEDPMVNSSETLLQDTSVVNSDFNNSVSDSSLLNESQSEDNIELDNAEFNVKNDEEKSNISESSAYTKYCEDILNKKSSVSAGETLAVLSDDNSENTFISNESNNGKKENLTVQDTSNVDTALTQDVNIDAVDTEVSGNVSIVQTKSSKRENANNDYETLIKDTEKLESEISEESGGIMNSSKETDRQNNVSTNSEVKPIPPAETADKSMPESIEVTMVGNENLRDSDLVCNVPETEIEEQFNEKDAPVSFTETPQESKSDYVDKETVIRKKANSDSDVVCSKFEANMSDNLSVEHDSLSSKSPDSKQKSLPKKNLSEKKSASENRKSSRRKKCPKIKLSFVKNTNADSPDKKTLKNWCVSESTKSDEPQRSNPTEVLATSSEFSDIEKSTGVDKVGSADLVSNEQDGTSSEENSSVSSNITSSIDKVHRSSSENSSTNCSGTSHSNTSSVDVEIINFPIKIKEEPMDFEENTEVNSKKETLKINPELDAEGINTRGKRRKSNRFSDLKIKVESPKTDMASKENKKVKKIKTPAKETTKTIKTPAKETTVSTTPRSGGQKKKSISGSTSTPTSGRKKNYDPELVCVPFAMGWMREHVIRAAGKDGKRQSDIYYFSPDGGKLRSMPEIANFLSKHPDIKLTAANFTFAKELIYREPFEIERDAKHPSSKPLTPINKASMKMPLSSGKKKSPTKRPFTPTSLEDANKKDKSLSKLATPSSALKDKVPRQRHSSSFSKQTNVSETDNKKSVSGSKKPKGAKQTNLDDYLKNETETTVGIASRPSRKIVKKVPFDNSFENMFPKMPKLIAKRNSSGKFKINIKSEPIDDYDDSPCDTMPKESVVLSVNKENGQSRDSSSSSVTKSSELIVDEPSADKPLADKPLADKPSVDKPSVDKPSEDKPVSASTSITVTEESLLERTNIKSPTIKNKLKVKFTAPRKSDVVLHNPCSKYCNFASVRHPSVQCCVCLCLFHPECIPFKNDGGLTKFCCVPCVKTKLDVLDDEITSVAHFPPDFNLELLYPQIDLQIKTNNHKFNRTFNKFYSRVDPSFAHSRMSDNGHNKTYSMVYPCNSTACSMVNPNNSSSKYPLIHPLRAPVPFNMPNMLQKGYQGHPPIPSFPGTRVSNPNINIANCGNLPLLQNFSNSFFLQNQPGNKTALAQPHNFQNSFCQTPRYSNAYVGPAVNVLNPKGRNPVVFQRLTRFPQNNEHLPPNRCFIVSSNTANCQRGPTTSVLQTLLQSSNTQKINSLNVTQLSAEKLQKINLNDYIVVVKSNPGLISPTTPVSKQELLSQASSSFQIDPKDNDKNSDDITEKPAKKMKCDESENSGASKIAEKNNANNRTDLDHYSSFWNFNNKFSQIYECLNLIFKYLNVSDLLSASLVCRSWNHLANQKLLWEYACFSKSFVKNWGKCCRTLKRYKTRCVDFRGIYNQESESEWRTFVKYLNNLTEVEELIFEKVPPFVINEIADSLPQLKRLTCYCMTSVFTEPEIWSTPCEFKLATLRCLGRLESLKISSMGGINLDNTPQSLMPYLPKLTHVVLTGFKFNCFMNLECLSLQKELITLELGDCVDIEPQLYELLTKLTNLENLCLQNGGIIHDTKLPEALSNMSKLRTLELMNFRISSHLPDVLKKMDTLHHFSVWPDNTFKPAQVNFNSFSSATSCTNLKSLCWGILTDDEEAVPNALELQDDTKSKIKKLSFEELFQSLVKHYPGVKVEVKCLPRSIWSEFCSSRNFV